MSYLSAFVSVLGHGKPHIRVRLYEFSKIQQSIRIFGEPKVIIEGHTDSTGSNELNELLSQERSESVRQYLLANKTLSYDRIAAVGYGSSKPLASNATEEGRAVNRRIDVIIKPQAHSGGS